MKGGVVSLVVAFLTWRGASSELNCTINGNKHNYMKISDPVYDIDVETIIPYEQKALVTEGVNNVQIVDGNCKIFVNFKDDLLQLHLNQIDERNEISSECGFDCKCTIRLQCNNGQTVDMYTTIPVIDTNNHEPFFTKPIFTYNLISSHAEDFKRQQILNPIIAADYDITNTKLQFTIEANDYFDIVYNGIVPNTLNKQHYALIVPKVSVTLINKKLELSLTVKDVGYPHKEARAKLLVNLPSPPIPLFDKTFYVGHYYKNNTFVFNETIYLQEGTTFYHTTVQVLDSLILSSYIENGKIIIHKYINLDEGSFYQQNYIAYELMADYEDKVTGLNSRNKATLIMELHHDL